MTAILFPELSSHRRAVHGHHNKSVTRSGHEFFDIALFLQVAQIQQHRKIFIGTYIFDHCPLASLCRFYWARDRTFLRTPSTWRLGHQLRKTTVASQAPLHPEQIQCLELHHSISSLSASNRVIPAKAPLPCVMTALESLELCSIGWEKFWSLKKVQRTKEQQMPICDLSRTRRTLFNLILFILCAETWQYWPSCWSACSALLGLRDLLRDCFTSRHHFIFGLFNPGVVKHFMSVRDHFKYQWNLRSLL